MKYTDILKKYDVVDPTLCRQLVRMLVRYLYAVVYVKLLGTLSLEVLPLKTKIWVMQWLKVMNKLVE